MRRFAVALSIVTVSTAFMANAIAADAPMAAPATPAAPLAAPQPTDQEKPLLVIRFNQHRVYFDRALRQAVGAAERTRAGVHYDVLSLLPQTANAQMEQEAKGQLADVLKVMMQSGVMQSRIRAQMKLSPEVTSHEIQIYVQ